MTRKRVTVGGKNYRRLVLQTIMEAIKTHEASKPIEVRTLLIDFEARTVDVDGQLYGPIESPRFAMPILNTEHPIGRYR